MVRADIALPLTSVRTSFFRKDTPLVTNSTMTSTSSQVILGEPASSATHPRVARRHRRQTMKLLFILPAAVFFSVIVIVPVLTNFFYGLTDWNGYSAAFNFVGIDNFIKLFNDLDVRNAVGNTLVFTLINAPLQIGIGLILALALKRPGRFTTFLRVTALIPIAVSGVVLSFLGEVIFDPKSGILHTLSAFPGLQWLDQNWLGSPTFAMGSIIFMQLWQWSGFTMIVFIAGMATIPGELYEAARIDGANYFQQFRAVTWPMLAPSATINVVLTVIGGLKVFDIIYVLTRGGPGQSTESIVMRVASQGGFAKFGYSAATSFGLTVLVLIISLLLLAVLRRREFRA